MVRRALIAIAAVAGILFATTPADAMCRPGRIGIENGRPVVELPHCDPHPQ